MTTSEVFRTERECILRNESDNCNRDCASCDLVIDCDEILKAYDKVLDLLEKQEQGLIIELPVSLGTKVYSILYNFGVPEVYDCCFDIDAYPYWGDIFFATKEEAEKQLEELMVQGLHTCNSTDWEGKRMAAKDTLRIYKGVEE